MTVYDKNGNPIPPSGIYREIFGEIFGGNILTPDRWTCLRCKSKGIEGREYHMNTKFCVCGAPQEWSVKK